MAERGKKPSGRIEKQVRLLTRSSGRETLDSMLSQVGIVLSPDGMVRRWTAKGFLSQTTTPLSAPFHRSSCWAPGGERASSAVAESGDGGISVWYLWYGVLRRMMIIIIITRDKEDVLQFGGAKCCAFDVPHRVARDQHRRRSRPQVGTRSTTPVRWGGTALDRSGSARGGRAACASGRIQSGDGRGSGTQDGEGRCDPGRWHEPEMKRAHPRRLSGTMDGLVTVQYMPGTEKGSSRLTPVNHAVPVSLRRRNQMLRENGAADSGHGGTARQHDSPKEGEVI
jgi:hypothetical protein